MKLPNKHDFFNYAFLIFHRVHLELQGFRDQWGHKDLQEIQ